MTEQARDSNQAAHATVQAVVGMTDEPPAKNPAAVALGAWAARRVAVHELPTSVLSAAPSSHAKRTKARWANRKTEGR